MAFCDYFKLRTLVRTHPTANQWLLEQNKVVTTALCVLIHIRDFYCKLQTAVKPLLYSNFYTIYLSGFLIKEKMGDSVFTVNCSDDHCRKIVIQYHARICRQLLLLNL